MNKFLQQQLEQKVEKFFKDRTDQFVVDTVRWFSYGGLLEGAPSGMSEEDFGQLKKLIGEDLLARYISDARGDHQYFSALSLSDRDFLSNFHVLLMDECYQRLRKNTYTALAKKSSQKIARLNRKIAKLEEETMQKVEELKKLSKKKKEKS